MKNDPAAGGQSEPRAVHLLSLAGEGLVLALVCVSPWLYGSVAPLFRLVLYAGVALLALLWGARMLAAGRLTWQRCPVAVCLGGLFLLGMLQLLPLSRDVLEWLSPGTARLYEQLLPARPETLAGGAAVETPGPPAGSTISLYPYATRQALIDLLAVFLLFVIVRNTSTAPGSLRRLTAAVLVNGTLLALFGLLQFSTAPHDTVYWSTPTDGQVFGPFVNRDHFAMYLNLCIGLGLGCLLARLAGQGGRRGHREWSWHALLRDPYTLWIGVGLALMLCSVAVTLSRGGILALLGASVVCLLVKLPRSRRFLGPGVVLVVGGLAAALVIWFGFSRIEARLATVWEGEALQNRLPVWSRSMPVAGSFPLWGTGYGTFEFVEPAQRGSANEIGLVYEHAHNEYLEALVEGGLVRLLLCLLAIFLVARLGMRALYANEGTPAGALALGGLFAFSTAVIHSSGEFGVHVPAITLLLAVLCAQLCALGSAGRAAYALRLGGLAPLAGAATAVALGLLVVAEGWRTQRAAALRVAAFDMLGQATPPTRDTQVALVNAAIAICPESALLHAELAQVHLYAFEEQAERLDRGQHLAQAVQLVAAFGGSAAAVPAVPPAVTAGSSCLAASAARQALIDDARRKLAGGHLQPALRHFVQARDLCPLLPEPHVRLGAHADRLAGADPRAAYLERAKLLVPFDPELWYLCGQQELADGRPEAAWASWRRSLELSGRFLPEILERGGRHLARDDLAARVLPERADVLVRAANQLYPEGGGDGRRRLLRKALELLEGQAEPLKAEELHDKGSLHAALGQPARAVQAYRAALDLSPRRMDWRFDLARVLQQQGQLQEAWRELSAVVEQQPAHAEARTLLEAVTRQLAER